MSPSLFLDLPPTPPRLLAADAPGDIDLDFISRMLMEEDIDDRFFYQYPDHPAILSAHRAFAQIISDDRSAAATTSSDYCSSATTGAKSTPTTSSSDSPDALSASPTAACWPRESPVDLSVDSHAALPKGSGDDSFGAVDRNGTTSTAEKEKENGSKPATTATFLAGGSDDGAFTASAFFNGGGAMDDMLSLAFRKGMEEASKFLPSATNNSLLVDPDSFSGGDQARKEEADGLGTLMFGSSNNGRSRKHRHSDDEAEAEAEAGRSRKVMAPEPEEVGTDARQMFDEIMLHGYDSCMQGIEDLRIAMGSEAERNIRNGTGGKAAAVARRGKRRGAARSEPEVDLRTMLIHCAQAVATGDHRSSADLLSQVKQHCSPKGDATQRLAYCFAEGLEARLAGTGSQVYQSLMAKRTSVVEYLRAYKLYMAASSFKKVNMAFVGKTIVDAMAPGKGRDRLHIVDYNVQYGFQWPGLLQWLSIREGGPPEVRITGIDLPQPGFRPAFQIEETGRRLTDCAREFGVPFKFHGIAAKWETVRAEDINIDPDEFLVVTSQAGFGNLLDESVVMDRQDIPSPRDMVLNNIGKMRPDVFIDCVVNGTYGAPFFVTRFREALYYYSAQFDMLDATIPRDNDERLLIERDIFGRCALNVVACEGADRVERPETYKQWQVRGHRAGMRQLPLCPEVVKVVRDKVKNYYHKDFVIDVDNRWLLQGWKGRVLYAMSTWVAADDDKSRF
ncbi:hypothetical protein BRADI_4g09196v3 [Brachypodium distachyon]|uniref:Uncharacterized protein n=2 Tax=Brachypodium distachyon TaxID=15368 RepID=A0A2K2CLH4_BRADI|nr:hypothetical protein BRADI_4g09196v3 [Brachypodium distachyon]